MIGGKENRPMRKRWLSLSLCLCLLALPTFGSVMDWSVVGSGGEIDEDCVGLYEHSGARVKFRSTQIGTITVRYPVSVYGNANGLQPPWDTLRITSIDNSPLGSVNGKNDGRKRISNSSPKNCWIKK